MNNIDIVNRFITAFRNGDTKTLDELLAPDYAFHHVTNPQPLDKGQYLDVVRAISTALPDLAFNESNMNENGNIVKGDLRLSGTQRGPLDLHMLGMPTIPPTNKAVELPPENASWTIVDGQITEHNVKGPSNGGIPGILEAIGAGVATIR